MDLRSRLRSKPVVVALSILLVAVLLWVTVGPRHFEARDVMWTSLYQTSGGDALAVVRTRKGYNRWTVTDSITLAREDWTQQVEYSLIKLTGADLAHVERIPGTAGPIPRERVGVPRVAGWEPYGIVVETTSPGFNTITYWPFGGGAPREVKVRQLLSRSDNGRYYLVERDSGVTVWDCREWKDVAAEKARPALAAFVRGVDDRDLRMCDDGLYAVKLPYLNRDPKVSAIRVDTGEIWELGFQRQEGALQSHMLDAEVVDGKLQFIRVRKQDGSDGRVFDVLDSNGAALYTIPLWLFGSYSWNPQLGIFIVPEGPDLSTPLAMFDRRTGKTTRVTPQVPFGPK